MIASQCLTTNDFWVLAIFCIGVSVVLDKVLLPLIKMTIDCFKKKTPTVITEELTFDQAISELENIRDKDPKAKMFVNRIKLK